MIFRLLNLPALIYSVPSFFLVVVSFHPFPFEKIFQTLYAKSEAFLMDPLDFETL